MRSIFQFSINHFLHMLQQNFIWPAVVVMYVQVREDSHGIKLTQLLSNLKIENRLMNL